MLDHMTFRVRNLSATRSFYESALAPLGYRLGYQGEHDGVRMLGFEQGGRFDTWFVEAPAGPSGPTHLAWRASTRAAAPAPATARVKVRSIDDQRSICTAWRWRRPSTCRSTAASISATR